MAVKAINNVMNSAHLLVVEGPLALRNFGVSPACSRGNQF